MRSHEDPAKVVESTYKVLLDSVTPGLRQCVTSGKLYVKSLQNATIASRGYMDSLVHLANLADNSPSRDVVDLGAALTQLVQIQRELAIQQADVIMSLDVDFLGPLEMNVEKDSKQLSRDLKQFQQDHKKFSETHSKAISTLNKSKKKNRGHSDGMYIQNKEDAERRLYDFYDDSLAEAAQQECDRYEFVFRRHVTLASQCLDFHRKAQEVLERHMDKWKDMLDRNRGPKELPPSDVPVERELSDHGHYDPPFDPEPKGRVGSSPSLRSLDEDIPVYAKPLPRSKSDRSLPPETEEDHERLTRMTECNGSQETSEVRALYPFNASGEHQLSLQEGDVLTVVTRKKDGGWMFGENKRTKRSGWFPISYTERLPEEPTKPGSQPGRDSLRPNLTDREPVASLRGRRSLNQSYDSLSGDGRPRSYPVNPPKVPSPASSGASSPELRRPSRDQRQPPGGRYRGDGEPSRYPR